MSMSELIRYKMVLFGNEGTGKTSLVNRFVNDQFSEDYVTTLGYNVYEKQFLYNDITISLMIFDIGGQERFRNLRKQYSKGANTAFILYDITDRGSFNKVRYWKSDLYNFAGKIPFVIIGTKLDLEVRRQVDTSEALKLSSELGALDFTETSSKTGDHVQEAFIELVRRTHDTLER